MTLLVGCGSDPGGSSSPPSTSDPTDPGASANGKTTVTDPGTTVTPTGPSQTDPGQTQTTPDPKPVAKPTFAFAPDFADFAETMLGESTKPQTVTLTNTSDVDAAGVGLHLNGSQFVLGTTDCAGAMKARGTCQAEITFHPTLAIAAEGFLYLTLNKSDQAGVAVHLTGTGKEAPMDPGMSGPPVYPPGTYPMCAAGTSMGHTDAGCGTAEKPLKKDGFLCSLCLVGSTQECLPDHSGTVCVASCGECK